MKKLYILLGLVLIIISAVLLTWFYPDFIYLITNPKFGIFFERFLPFIGSLFLGIIYLYIGIKSDKINKLSNWSIVILVSSLFLSFILTSILGCNNVGGVCPSYTQVSRQIYQFVIILGPLFSFLLIILSLLKKDTFVK
jgi:hypothetical protein